MSVLFLFGTVSQSVSAQTAAIASVTPNQTPVGQVPTKIVIKGSNFVPSATVFLNSTQVAAKVKTSGRKIVVKSPPADLFQTSGRIGVRVVASGQSSNTVFLVVGSLNSIRITEPQSLVVNTKNSIQLRAVVVDQNGNPVPNASVAFQSVTPDKATVTAAGLVTGVTSGGATIRLTSGDAVLLASVAVAEVAGTAPSGIFGDGDIKVDGTTGTVYATDLGNHVVRSRGIGQPLTDFAGATGVSGAADGTFSISRFNGPLGLGLGNKQVLLADTANRAVRRLNLTTGQTETLIRTADVTAASGASSWGPRGVLQVADDIFVTDGENHVIWRARISGGQVSMAILAGSLGQPGLADGLGTSARFNTPQEVQLGNGNTLAVTDRVNKVVRLVALPSGAVSTLGRAGAGRSEGEFEPNADLLFTDPKGLAADDAGNLYITDGDRVRVVSLGNGTALSVEDLAQSGTFKTPIGVSIAGSFAFVLDAGLGQVLQLAFGPPTIASITPTQISVGQAADVVVTGTNFLPDTQVRVGTRFVSGVVFDGSTRLRFTLPAQTQGGTLPVVVQHRGGSVQTSIIVNDPAVGSTTRISFDPTQATASPGGRVSVTINFEVGAGTGQQPGTVTLDIPLDATRFDLANATVTPGTLIPLSLYQPGDLAVAPISGGLRVILSSSRDPLRAKLSTGKGGFCTLTFPVLQSSPSGSVPLNVSNAPPFTTQLNQSLADGGRPIPFASTPGSITVQ